jgi:transposase
MENFMDFRGITDEQWTRVSPFFLREKRSVKDGRGRPLSDTRSVLNGVLWVMYSGASWSDLPGEYPPYTTCHRRFKAWCESGIFGHVSDALAGWGTVNIRDLVRSRTRGVWSHPFSERSDHADAPKPPETFEVCPRPDRIRRTGRDTALADIV